MSAAEEALAKARAIAARLSGGIASDLGKRKSRDDDRLGLGALKQRRVYIPTNNSDINFLGLLIGPKGSTQKQLQERSGAKILFRGKGASKDGAPSGHPDDDDELHVFIEGSEEAVEKAEKEVRDIIFNPEEASRLKAEQLRSLGGGSSSSDNIYGPGVGGGGISGDSIVKEIHVPNPMVGLIIGKGGENILRIQAQLQVNAQIAKEHEMKPGDTTRLITLRGAASAVEEAQRRIDDIINQQLAKQGVSSIDMTGQGPLQRELNYPFVVKLPVPNDKVGIIIGKGGATIKGIQDRSRTNVQIPQVPDSDNPQVRTLSIGGDTKEAVDAAQMEIFMTLQTHEQGTQQTSAEAIVLAIPNDRVGVVIGKQGATVKDIQNRLSVRIQIPQQPDPGSNPPVRSISITGLQQMQAMAKYEIEMIVAGTPLHNAPSAGAAQQYGAAGYYGAYGAYDMYGQQAAYMYGAAGMQPYGAAMAGYYGAAAAQGATAATGATGAAEAPTDATAYYNDYWHYASYYGEATVRSYYGAWAPPEGTPPPAGITVATPEVAAANAAAHGVTLATSDSSAAVAAAPSSAGSDAAAAASTAVDSVASAAAANATNSAAADQSAAADDPAAAAAAWEAYKKQYQEWYEAHGKAMGADPNPPMQ